MTDLVPVIGGVLRSGIGLNTRAGAGRFIARLCLSRGSLVRPHAGKLFKVGRCSFTPGTPWFSQLTPRLLFRDFQGL